MKRRSIYWLKVLKEAAEKRQLIARIVFFHVSLFYVSFFLSRTRSFLFFPDPLLLPLFSASFLVCIFILCLFSPLLFLIYSLPYFIPSFSPPLSLLSFFVLPSLFLALFSSFHSLLSLSLPTFTFSHFLLL